MKPSVSVIIPAYNAEKTIGQCLKALTVQSYPHDLYEIIVVDDGSTDGLSKVVNGYPVRYIRQGNKGPAAARNRGVKDANNEIILFTDSDCVPDADWIREMVRPFEDSAVIAVKGAYRTRQRSVVARFAQIEFEERFEMLKKSGLTDMVDTYSAGFRKGVFLQLGGFDTSFPVANNEDTELSYRMSNLGYKMVFNPDAIVYHLNHPDSIKRYARLKFWRGYWRMVVYRRFPDKMVKDSYTPQTLKLEILFLFIFAAGLPFTFLFPYYTGFPLIAVAIIFFLLMTPFIVLTLKKDPVMAFLTPLLISLRAASIGLGVLWGIIRRPGNSPS